jgi:hypothetical protein
MLLTEDWLPPDAMPESYSLVSPNNQGMSTNCTTQQAAANQQETCTHARTSRQQIKKQMEQTRRE